VLTLLFYEPADGPATPLGDVEHALRSEPGLDLLPLCGAEHAAGRWHDPATGAACVVDLGAAPLELDPLHPPTRYAGWRELHLALHLPLAVPHWHCVETLHLVERLTGRLPEVRALDSEDTRESDETDAGPFTWNRLRVLANWEHLAGSHRQGRQSQQVMERLASVALWRYRRERAVGSRRHPGLVWPEALVLADDGSARSAVLWSDPTRPFALPPVELVVVRRAVGAGVLPADEVLTAAGGGTALDAGQAVALAPTAALVDLHARARLLPAERFKALGDGDWVD